MIRVNDKIQIDESELEESFVRSSGPGGQNVNKVSSKAQLRWCFSQSRSIPGEVRERFLERFGGRLTKSGDLMIRSERFRDQRRNQADCLEKLKELLLQVAYPPKVRKKTKPGRGAKNKARLKKERHSQKKQLRSARSWNRA